MHKELYEPVRLRLQELRREMVEFLAELVRTESRRTEAEDGKPFGGGVSDVFVLMLNKASEDGFEVFDADGYGGHISYKYQSEDSRQSGEAEAAGKTMGILCHLDVVPEGEGWSFPPFGAVVEDGKMYGRGTSDDKGPTVAAYYAMRAIADAGIPLKDEIRLILGLDEETGCEGIEYYIEKAGSADYGFTPDANFPLITKEKGILTLDIVQKQDSYVGTALQLRKLDAGQADNMVAEKARAVIFSGDEKDYKVVYDVTALFDDEKRSRIKCKKVGKSLEILTFGKSAHAAAPEKGENAISLMMEILSKIKFESDAISDFVKFFQEKIGYETDGRSIGIAGEDESGHTTLIPAKLSADKKDMVLTLNIRYPVGMEEAEIHSRFEEAVSDYDIGIIYREHNPPINFDDEDALAKKLLTVYRETTGDQEAASLATGGGTYARCMDNIIAFGMLFPEEEEVFHQPDEYVNLDNMFRAAEIYAAAMIELAGY